MGCKEIGSEFWDVPTCSNSIDVFPSHIQWYLSGRSALQAIIRDLPNLTSVMMPSWCCDSMIKPFVDAGVDVIFYPVYANRENGLIQEIQGDADALFLIDYFGYTTSSLDINVNDFKGVIIRDVTHSIFSRKYNDADYYFGSLRKWCGVWTGGYAWTRNGHQLYQGAVDKSDYVILRDKAMRLKNSYINEYIGKDGKRVADKGFLKVFNDAENLLNNCGISFAAERDIELAKKMDYELIKSHRRENAKVLMKIFHDWLIFPKEAKDDCPMFVPVIVPDGRRDQLRIFLIENQIYCPVHWPLSKYHKGLNKHEKCIYDSELSLVCDHRYTEEDMQREADMIKMFMGEE